MKTVGNYQMGLSEISNFEFISLPSNYRWRQMAYGMAGARRIARNALKLCQSVTIEDNDGKEIETIHKPA